MEKTNKPTLALVSGLTVNNLETTRRIENTITGQMVDVEELRSRRPGLPAGETGNLDTLTMQNKLANGHGRQELDKRRNQNTIEIIKPEP
jgi:hypothetical protein